MYVNMFVARLNYCSVCKWSELEEYLVGLNKEVYLAKPDGFCLLNSVQTALVMEKNLLLNVGEMKEELIQHFEDNLDFYATFHCVDDEEDEKGKDIKEIMKERMKPVNLEKLGKAFIADVLNYFTTGNWKLDVVDMVLRGICKVLNINILVYQNVAGDCKVTKQTHCPQPMHTVEVLYRGRHYDAIVTSCATSSAVPTATSRKSEMKKERKIEDKTREQLKKDWREELRLEIKQEIKQEIKKEIEEDLKASLKPVAVRSNTKETAIMIESSDSDADDFTQVAVKVEEPVKKKIFKNIAIDLTGVQTSDEDEDDKNLPDIEETVDSDETMSIADSEMMIVEDIPSETFTNPDSDSDAFSSISSASTENRSGAAHKKKQGPRRNMFPVFLFKESESEIVSKIPYDLNGKKYYILEDVEEDDWIKSQKDGWHFHMVTTTRKEFIKDNNIFKIGKCQGSYKCPSPECAFLEEAGKVNTQNFNRDSNTGAKVCFTCGHYAEKVACNGKKYTHYNIISKELKVYHLNTHKCALKADHRKYDAFIDETVKSHPNLPPKKLQIQLMAEALKNKDMVRFTELAEKLANKKRITAKRHDLLQSDPFYNIRNDFVAISDLKKDMDKTDKYFIFEINPKNLNNDPSYIFKSNLWSAKLAAKMDPEDEKVKSEMQHEAFYFDVMYNRTLGYKTLTGWTYHAASRRVVLLALMEIEKESTEVVQIFWKCMNKMVSQVTGQPGRRFNPSAFMCDEHHANKNSLIQEFGIKAAKKVVTCQWHYKNCAAKKQLDLALDDRKEFLEICVAMTICQVKDMYENLYHRMMQICKRNKAVVWAKWWHSRRDHIVPVFRTPCRFDSNVTEIGHSSIKSYYDFHKKDVILVDACREDISCLVLQEYQVELFLKGEIPSTGKGPTQLQQQSKMLKQDRQKIRQFGKFIRGATIESLTEELRKEDTTFVPGVGAKHKAPKRGSKAGVQGKEVALDGTSKKSKYAAVEESRDYF